MSGFNNRESILARPCMGFYQLSLSGGLADSSVAIQRVDAECSQRVSMAIVIGTPISAPGIPQRKLQKNTAKTTARGEMASAAPAISGSR